VSSVANAASAAAPRAGQTASDRIKPVLADWVLEMTLIRSR
jgi:hypothetical protein